MKGKRIVAWLLLTAILAGTLPTAAYAAEKGSLCENHQEHTAACGYAEARPCSHACELCTAEGNSTEPEASEQDIQKATDSNSVPLMGTKQYGIAGDGYSFDESSGKLIISSDDGTTAWKDNADIDSADIKTVILESDVTSIGKEAFSNCTNLARVSLPDELTSIGYQAFLDCKNLSLTSLPDGVTSIGSQAFLGCKKLALTSLPDGLTDIPAFSFSGCENLALTSLPDSVTSIGSSAFSNCTNLALDSLPDHITAISEYAFEACKKLKLTKLPDSVTSIGNHAFYECSSLALTSLPDGLISIGRGAFWKCTGLSSLTFSDMEAPALGENAFHDIPDLILFVPCKATGYDGENWPAERVVYGAALSGLIINEGTLNPEFFPGTNTYDVSVAGSVEGVSMIPVAHASEAITVNGTVVESGASSGKIALTAGEITAIAVTVKNSEADSRTYTVSVMRKAPDTVPVTDVSLDKTAMTLYTNKSPGSMTLSATVRPDNAAVRTVTWSSSAPDIATVDSSGKVTAVSPGQAIITVTTTEGGKTATCEVTVKEEATVSIPVTAVTISRSELTLYTHKAPDSVILYAAVQPDNATNQTVTWSSSAPDIAMVDNRGKVTAVSPGLAVITVTAMDGGKTAACAVTVESGSSSGSGSGGGSRSSSSDSGPSYFQRVLIDKPTGVRVAGSQINEYAALTVRPGILHNTGDAGCDLLRTAQGAGRVLSIYDVSLSREFYGTVTVSIPVEGRDGQTMTVVRCVGGRLILSNVTAESGLVMVTADSLSPFILLNDIYTLDTLTAPETPAPDVLPPDSDRVRRYQVKKGDTLSALALRFNCTVAELVAANSMIKNPNVIFPGWILNIP